MPKPYDVIILDYFNRLERKFAVRPLNLGGVSSSGGGAGGPPGGFIGKLPQTRVTYDSDELASSGLPTVSGVPTITGATLLDNLNHIRYRIQTLETAGGGSLIVKDNDVVVASGVTVLNFEGGITTTVIPSGVTITVTGSGGGDTYKSKVSSDDTTEDYLESKIVAGSNVTITTLNPGANETLQINATASGVGSQAKTVFYSMANYDSSTGDFPSLTSGTGSTVKRIVFRIPTDFNTLTGVYVIIITTASTTTQNFDLVSDYGQVNEAYTTHSESANTGALSWSTNTIIEVDVSSVFSSLSANDYCGLGITKKVNETLNYIGLVLKYTT